MSTREFTVLGTASQTPTRYRAHNGYVLKWDDQAIMFDPGEGTQRQCTLAKLSISKLTAVCITHFHGDHCLGLPGVIQRRALDNNHNKIYDVPLPIFYPEQGSEYLANLRKASIFKDSSNLETHPISEGGPLGTLANLELSALPLNHRTATFGYRLQEPDSRKIIPAKLAEYDIAGPIIKDLKANGQVTTPSGVVKVKDVSLHKPGQAVAFVMDTAMCDEAYQLADQVDLLVCESTFAESEKDLARDYKHLTAKQAATIAKESGVKKLLITHFSARYANTKILLDEAREIFPNTVAGKDLESIKIPRSEAVEDG